jgi:hypothetical protein
MNRFPRKGDFIRFKQYFSVHIRDTYNGVNSNANFIAGDLYQILDIQTHDNSNSRYSIGTMDVVPFSILVGVHDKLTKPVVVRFTYENIDSNTIEFIPGDNPQTVETLYGRSP